MPCFTSAGLFLHGQEEGLFEGEEFEPHPDNILGQLTVLAIGGGCPSSPAVHAFASHHSKCVRHPPGGSAARLASVWTPAPPNIVTK